MVYRTIYIRFMLLCRARSASINVLIKISLCFFNFDLVIPVEVVDIRRIFQPEETMYVCRAPMFPFISAKGRNGNL